MPSISNSVSVRNGKKLPEKASYNYLNLMIYNLQGHVYQGPFFYSLCAGLTKADSSGRELFESYHPGEDCSDAEEGESEQDSDTR